jgi:uncharacterized protein
MPLVQSQYQASFLWKNPHFSTIVPSVFRKVQGVNYTRTRLELSDGDFLDLDWSYAQSETDKLVIVSHGFLGDSNRGYVKGCVKSFNSEGYDALAWNHRGLGGENNRLERLTIHGSSEDLAAVVEEALRHKKYTQITLVGYSKGGNVVLKYLGEQSENIHALIKNAISVSAPLDMQGSVDAMAKGGFYTNRFRDKLLKFLKKRTQFLSPERLKTMESYQYLDDFTDYYIAPLHGMKDATEYYAKTSALPYIDKIRIPTLILTAQNDPVLSPSCSPVSIAEKSEYIYLENPLHGGHCAFYEPNKDQLYWADKRIVEFVREMETEEVTEEEIKLPNPKKLQ